MNTLAGLKSLEDFRKADSAEPRGEAAASFII